MDVFKWIDLKLLGILTLFVSFSGVLPAQTKYVKANGITLAYETFGDPGKETILLICGTGSQLVDWPVAFCEQLADAGFQVPGQVSPGQGNGSCVIRSVYKAHC